ncbi:hypothetical protein A4X13_0g6615 [Tilletia indica]|uniref:Sec23/Sec24 trunk domain-containing protein n=1 Tax=Tilletia indica TaxID=43049 RepID=A0A8T8SNP7_9BASI|nr:hypothetical protein A4X13_0g6615 [Tilletia indica]
MDEDNVKALRETVVVSLSLLPPHALVGLITFGTMAQIHDFGYETQPALTASDVSKVLAAPAAAVSLLGKDGAVAIFCLFFLAVNSALSAQLIAVSCVITFNIYQPLAKKPAEKSLF